MILPFKSRIGFYQKLLIFRSDQFLILQYIFNIHYRFLPRRHFVMFFLKTTHLCFLKILQIFHVNKLNLNQSKIDGQMIYFGTQFYSIWFKQKLFLHLANM